jgi:hypothetical protein
MSKQINIPAEILKNISKKLNFYSEEAFISDATAYISAIKENRMINVIGSVSASGMSRTLKFTSCEKNETTNQHYQRNYFSLFRALGFTPVKRSDYFRVSGCGMDMIFATHYDIIHQLKRIGLISDEECEKLCQRTPSTI